MFLENVNFSVDAYKDATRKPYIYLLINLTPKTDDRFQIRSSLSKRK